MTWMRRDGPQHGPPPDSSFLADTECGPGRFFEAALAAFACALENTGGSTIRTFRIGGETVRLRFAGPALVDVLTPALAHLSVEEREARPASLEVCVFDTGSTGSAMPRAPWGPDDYGPRGQIAGFNTERYRTVYEPGVNVLQMFDREIGTGIYWVRDRGAVPYWERGLALRTMLHWRFRDTALQLVHAGAVGTAEGGVLITGPSGSGKSTTCLACLEGGLLYAGDDYVLAAVDEPYVHSLYNTAKLNPDNLARFPGLARWVINEDKLAEEKALLFLHPERRESLAGGFPIRAIVTPQVTGRRESRLRAVSPMVSLRSLAPTTVLQLPGEGGEAFAKMSRLVKAVPNYLLEAGTDLTRIPEIIWSLIPTT